MLKKYFFIFIFLFYLCKTASVSAEEALIFTKNNIPYRINTKCSSVACTIKVTFTGDQNYTDDKKNTHNIQFWDLRKRGQRTEYILLNENFTYSKENPAKEYIITNLSSNQEYILQFDAFIINGNTESLKIKTADWFTPNEFVFSSEQLKYDTFNKIEPSIQGKLLITKPNDYNSYLAFNNPQKGFKVKLEYIKEKQGVTDAEKFPSDGVMTVPASKDRAGKDIGINDDGTYYFALRALSPNTNYAIRETITPPVGDQKITVDSFNTGREYTPPNSIEEQKQFDLRSYRLLAPLPGINMILNPDLCAEQRAQGRKIEICSVDEFISFGIKFLIGLSAVFLVLRLMIDGYNIITTDVPFLKVSAQSDFKTSLGGLFLVLCSYLILNTINPRLVQNNLSIEKVEISSEQKGSISDTLYKTLTGEVSKSKQEYVTLVRELSKQNNFDECLLIASNTIESDWDAKNISCDEDVSSLGQIKSRRIFVQTGITNTGKTFTPATKDDVQPKQEKGIYKDSSLVNGGCRRNSSNIQKDFDWRFSRGIGLTQVTIFPKYYSGKEDIYIAAAKKDGELYLNKNNPEAIPLDEKENNPEILKFKTVGQALAYFYNPKNNITSAIERFKAAQKICGSNASPMQLFNNFAGLGCNPQKNRKDIEKKVYIYNQCKKNNLITSKNAVDKVCKGGCPN